jgi:hypothetical protein
MRIARRVPSDSTTLAAFWPCATRLACSSLLSSPAYVAREACERADEVGRQPADDARPHEHGLDVPVGVVVGEDRAVEVLVGAGRAQVAGGGEDRVDRVERVLLAVAVGVDPVHVPRGGHELHPAQRTG